MNSTHGNLGAIELCADRILISPVAAVWREAPIFNFASRGASQRSTYIHTYENLCRTLLHIKTTSAIAATHQRWPATMQFATSTVSVLCFLFANLPSPLGAATRHPLPSLRSHHWRPSPLPCSDYEMLIINTNYCVSRCPIRCINGRCFEDGDCPCSAYYQTSFEKEALVCAAECLPGCQSAGGFCAAPDLCLCSHKGYYFDAVARRCRKYHLFSDRCFGRCLYGKCTANGECICAQGFAVQETVFGQLCAPVCKQ